MAEATLLADNTQATGEAQTTETADAASTQAEGTQEQTSADAQQANEGASDKGEGEQPAVIGAPEKYEIKAPEGTEFDAPVIAELEAVARELDLSQHAAQKIADRVGPKIAERVVAQQLENFQKAREEWRNTAASDKEFGGDEKAFAANLAVAKKAFDAFGTEELRTFLAESGLGDHPELIRAFYRAGKQISEDTFVPSQGKPAGDKTLAERLYG